MEDPGVRGVAKSWTQLSDFTFCFYTYIFQVSFLGLLVGYHNLGGLKQQKCALTHFQG